MANIGRSDQIQRYSTGPIRTSRGLSDWMVNLISPASRTPTTQYSRSILWNGTQSAMPMKRKDSTRNAPHWQRTR